MLHVDNPSTKATWTIKVISYLGVIDLSKRYLNLIQHFILFQRTFLWSIWESNPFAGEHPSTDPFAYSSTTANYSTPNLASIWGNDLPNLLLVPKYISDKVFVHNTISSFVSSLISKHPYPYFNLNTITSAADILSVDSYMSIYAWSGYERIRTPTPSCRTVQPNFCLVLGIPFYQY